MRYEQWIRLRLAINSCYQGQLMREGSGERVTDYHSAWLVREGRAQLRTPAGEVMAGAGEWLIGGPGPRKQLLSEDITLVSLTFFANWPSGAALFPAGLPVAFPEKADERLLRLALKIDGSIERQAPEHRFDIHGREMRPEAYLQIQRHLPEFLLVLVEVLRGLGVHPAGEIAMDYRVSKALDILNAVPLDWPFSMGELAEIAGISVAHLDRLFQKQLGRTPKQHFDRRRMAYAEESLRRCEMQIKEIAYTLGFRSPGHFTRWFRRHQKCSPRQFRWQPG